MALPAFATLTPAELEFVAEAECIHILPMFSMDRLQMMEVREMAGKKLCRSPRVKSRVHPRSCERAIDAHCRCDAARGVVMLTADVQREVGPFRPSIPVEVPLWLALVLKRRRKCKIVAPDWLAHGV
jgi:hypothetical protein